MFQQSHCRSLSNLGVLWNRPMGKILRTVKIWTHIWIPEGHSIPWESPLLRHSWEQVWHQKSNQLLHELPYKEGQHPLIDYDGNTSKLQLHPTIKEDPRARKQNAQHPSTNRTFPPVTASPRINPLRSHSQRRASCFYGGKHTENAVTKCAHNPL